METDSVVFGILHLKEDQSRFEMNPDGITGALCWISHTSSLSTSAGGSPPPLSLYKGFKLNQRLLWKAFLAGGTPLQHGTMRGREKDRTENPDA